MNSSLPAKITSFDVSLLKRLAMIFSGENRITEQQLELLKSFQYLRDEEQLNEVKELLHLYFTRKLDAAIEKVEAERNYTAEVYESWLKGKQSTE